MDWSEVVQAYPFTTNELAILIILGKQEDSMASNATNVYNNSRKEETPVAHAKVDMDIFGSEVAELSTYV